MLLRECFTEVRAGDLSYESIATLADEPAGLTCSVKAAREWGGSGDKPYTIHGYPTFETAAHSVIIGKHDRLLVAGAYPDIKNIFFDEHLQACEARIVRLPDFVLAFPGNTEMSVEKLYYHSAVESLIKLTNISYRLGFTALTNSEVARLASRDADSAAITNSLCADYYELNTSSLLAQGKSQAFTLFERI